MRKSPETRALFITAGILAFVLYACDLEEIEPSSVNPCPVAVFSVGNEGCTPSCALQFTNQTVAGSNIAYAWKLGNTTFATTRDASYNFTSAGNYDITLTVTENGCSDDTTITVTVGSATKFEKVLSNLGPAVRVVELLGGGYAIAGTKYDASFKSDIYLLLTDADGNALAGFPKIYNDSDFDELKDFIQLGDGSFVLVGSTLNPVTNNTDGFYLRTSSTGAPSTGPLRVGNTAENDVAQAVIQIPDGNLVIVGNVYNTAAGNNDVFIRKVSPSYASIFFDKTIPGANDEFPYDVVHTDDGGFLIVGSTATPGGSTPANAMILKTDNNGNKSAGFPKSLGGGESESLFAALKTASGDIAMCGTVANISTGASDVYFLLSDQNGNPTPGFPVTLTTAAAESVVGLAIAPGGTYALAGSKNLDAYFLKLNANGADAGSKTYGVAGDDYFNAIIPTGDGGYLMAGSRSGVLYLVKTDQNGNR